MGSRFLPLALIVVAMTLALPSLWVGLHMDDYVHWAIASGAPALRDLFPSRLGLFAFVDGDPGHTRRLIDRGILPWWTFTGVRLAFWRPVASLTHWLDYTFWPDVPALMHVHSLVWLAALILTVALTYRRLMGPGWAAGLAGLLYAADDAHAVGIGWLANRNILLGTLFGALTLLIHDRWRRFGWRPGALVAPGCFAMGLLSAEAAVATAAYLAAYVCFLDPDTWRRRVLAILPYGVVGSAWQIYYQRMGYGVLAVSPSYVNPALEPVQFARAIIEHGPVLLLAQWARVPAETYTEISGRMALGMWLASLLAVAGLCLVLTPLLRRDAVARFWGLGQVLALLPICTASPYDRYLFFVGLGAMGLLARFLCGLLDRESWRPAALLWRLSAVAAACSLATIHLVVAPIQLVRTSVTLAHFGDVVEQSSGSLAADPGVSGQKVVVVNVPRASSVGYALFVRAAKGQPIPAHTLLLASSAAPVRLSRVDAWTLVVRPQGPQDSLFRPKEHPLVLNEQIRLSEATIQVTDLTPDGAPAEARVRFDVVLEDSSLRWLQWRREDGRPRYVTFIPPPVGETIDVR